jgi:hypothetical protein
LSFHLSFRSSFCKLFLKDQGAHWACEKSTFKSFLSIIDFRTTVFHPSPLPKDPQNKVGLWWGYFCFSINSNKKGIQPNQLNPFDTAGALDENRIRTPIRARDFKSVLFPKDIISLHFQMCLNMEFS